MFDQLETMSDAQLRELADQALQLARKKEAQRKKETIKKIKLMAAEVGLSVEVSEAQKKTKRGRPRKIPTPATLPASVETVS